MDENKELNFAETDAENNMNEQNNGINANPVSENDEATVSVQPNYVPNEAQGQYDFIQSQPNLAPNQMNFMPNMTYNTQPEMVEPPFQAEGRPFPPEYQMPTQPMYSPMQPVQPARPIAPQPMQPVQPVQPIAPQPMQPVQPVQPVAPQPMQPVQPAQPITPQPMQPVQPTQPVASQPMQPVQPVVPQTQYGQSVPFYTQQPMPTQSQYQPYQNQQPTYYPNQVNNQYYQPYGSYPYGYVPNNRGKGMALAALICGICGLVLCSGIVTGIILGALGVVFGFISRAKSKGNGKALAGIITGFIAIGLSMIILVAITGETYDYDYYDDDYYYDEYDRGEYGEDEFGHHFDQVPEDNHNGKL